MNPLLLTDGYKTGHHQQYPNGTTLVYSNFTPRSNRHAPKGCDSVVSFGQQMIMKQIHEMFQKEFFNKPKAIVLEEIRYELSLYLGFEYDTKHFEELYDLGYLPIKVKALPEGTIVPIKVPVLTIHNTNPKFYWLTNYLETIISNLLWKPITSATIAHQYKKLLVKWAMKTNPNAKEFVNFQGHDFSMRGMDSIDAVVSSGLGHLTSFFGTDSLPTLSGARNYYNEKEFIGASVPATEHSVMCAGGKEDEVETFRRLLNTYPKGILSVVSDTWDLWKVCTEHIVTLKEEIMSRDGKLVIRPDSGNPVDILCGIDDYKQDEDGTIYKVHYSSGMFRDRGKQISSAEQKGVIELLWDVFGGTVNEQGFKVLDPHIGAIYGDSITLEIAEQICKRLADKGFASTNVVLGIGSFTYQYNTRDTFGFAMKATYVEIDGKGVNIFKDPVTDSGMKKSATGLLRIVKNEGEYSLLDGQTWKEENESEMKTIYNEGKFFKQTTLTEVRSRLDEVINKLTVELQEA